MNRDHHVGPGWVGMLSLQSSAIGIGLLDGKNQNHLRVNPTTPTFLSDVEAAPDTNPVVYSPVPIIKTAGGAMMSPRVRKWRPRPLFNDHVDEVPLAHHVGLLVASNGETKRDRHKSAEINESRYSSSI